MRPRVKCIEMFESEDGKVYRTEEEARRRNMLSDLHAMFGDETEAGQIVSENPQQVLDYLYLAGFRPTPKKKKKKAKRGVR